MRPPSPIHVFPDDVSSGSGTTARVGGLAVAYVLSKAGHRVTVLERRDLNVPGGGHRVPPNLSKILRQWVGEEELMKVSTRCIGTPFHHSGEWAYLPLSAHLRFGPNTPRKPFASPPRRAPSL
ncbi:hypothetical protein LXA43DRAFT_570824 [Ganoderma leucocontextum]|nr:hypothetical protein LXA43DRAFT_570824 [Ganoderma leucocontextum]